MGVFDIFSTRNKPLPDVYLYDVLPQPLRIQIVHILQDALGDHAAWPWIANALAREHALIELPYTEVGTPWEPQRSSKYHDCLNYLLQAPPQHALDLVELAMRCVDRVVREAPEHEKRHLKQTPDGAINELNHRFRQHGVGYQYEEGNLVRVDSQLLHASVVKPALALLSHKGFEGPQQEFLTAHEHHRHGRIEDAITNACKAFESTIKAICDARSWPYDPKAAAGALISTLIDRGLVPAYLRDHLLGIATVRNKSAGHGAGAQPRNTPEHVAAFALHLAASNIVFLVECHRA